MKIVLNDVNDVEDFLRMLSPSYFRLIHKASTGMDALADNIAEPTTAAEYRERGQPYDMRTRHDEFVGRVPTQYDEPNGLPTDIPAPLAASMDAAVAETRAALRQEGDPTLDADGVPHSADWHSDPPKINADGRWKARRGRDNDAYKAWLLEQAVEVAEAAVAGDVEPVATETHALPLDEQQAGLEQMELVNDEMVPVAAPVVDLAALVEASQEAALDASDSHMDLIKACQVFISDHGHPAYNALKAAVAPLEGAENGKAVPQFTPAERRLMRACIENYPSN